MAVKLLISGLSNTGKTTLTSTLKDVLVLSHDGKNYPFPQAHTNIATFETAQQLIDLANEKILAYKDKFKVFPATVVWDSVSKIFDTILDNCSNKYTGFQVYAALNREIHLFTDYVQNTLIASDINVVLISHALYDADTATYSLVGKGDFSKRGGFLSETDEAIFVETKDKKRIIHHRSTKYPARTTIADIPDSQPVDEYNLQAHVDLLAKQVDAVSDFIL